MNEKFHFQITELILFLYVASVIVFSYDETHYVVSNALGVLLVATYIIEALCKKYFVLSVFTFANYLFLWFVLFCAFTLTYAPEGYLRMKTLAQIFILSLVITNVVGSSGRLWPVIYGTFSGLGYAIFRVYSEHPAGLIFKDNLQIASTLANANTYAIALLFGVVFSVYNIIKIRDTKGEHKIYFFVNYVFILFLGYQIINYTGSRKGIVLFCLALLFVYFYLLKESKGIAKFFYSVFGVVQFISLWIFIQSSAHFNRLEAFYRFGLGESFKDRSIKTRSSMFSDAIDLWTEKPLFGWGIDQFRFIGRFGTYSHSNISELLVNSGLVGAFLYYGIYVFIFYCALRFIKHTDARHKNIGLWLLLIIFILVLQDFAAVTYYSKLSWILLSSVLGLVHFYSPKTQEIARAST